MPGRRLARSVVRRQRIVSTDAAGVVDPRSTSCGVARAFQRHALLVDLCGALLLEVVRDGRLLLGRQRGDDGGVGPQGVAKVRSP